jgi:predicted transposase/invertase (TIGR01784 family)
LFYSSFLIRNQAPKEKVWNYELKAVYVVSILNFSLSEEKVTTGEKPVIERVSLMNERTKEKFSNKLKFIYIQLPNFTKTIEELQTNTDYWLFLLRNLAAFQNRPLEVQGRIFERLFNMARKDKLNSEEMKTYNKSILEYNDVMNSVQYAEERGEQRGISIGEKRGISIGEQRGEQRGISIGEQRGISIGEQRGEQRKVVEFVIKCHSKGMSVADIADLTDLSIEEVTDFINTYS